MVEFRSYRGIAVGLMVLAVGANAAPAVQTTTTEQTTTTSAPSGQVVTTTTTERTEQPVVRHPAPHKASLVHHPVRHGDVLVKETTTGESVTLAPVPTVTRTTTTETTNVR
jgi:hypothetical protein